MKLISLEERIARYKEKKANTKKKRLKKARPQKYKRKRGPKKKPGRKVSYYTRKKRERLKLIKKSRKPEVLYKIIITSDGKQKEYINYYITTIAAVENFNRIIEENKKSVKFPVKYIKTKNKVHDSNHEIILLKKNYDIENVEPTKLRDKHGILTDHIVNDEEWSVFDKAPYYYEEQFAVYGHHPHEQRKNFDWIYQNLLLNKLGEKHDLFRIMVHFTKVVILDDYDNFSMITCKCKPDAIRLYNLIVSTAKKDKIKQLIELNDISDDQTSGSMNIRMTNLIMKVTGWNRKKIIRNANWL